MASRPRRARRAPGPVKGRASPASSTTPRSARTPAGQEGHKRPQRQALARAGLADNAKRPTGGDLEADVPDSHIAALSAADADGQVAHPQEGAAH